MRAFRFRLQRLLGLAQAEEQVAARRLQAARQSLDAAAAAVAQASADRRAGLADLPPAATAVWMDRDRAHLALLSERQRQARDREDLAAAAVGAAAAAWQAAYRRCLTLSNLRQRKFKQYMQEITREEQKEIDSFSTWIFQGTTDAGSGGPRN